MLVDLYGKDNLLCPLEQRLYFCTIDTLKLLFKG